MPLSDRIFRPNAVRVNPPARAVHGGRIDPPTRLLDSGVAAYYGDCMGIEISAVESKRDLDRFIKFPIELYRGNPYWVPPLIRDERETLTPGKNPAYENAESRLFLALGDGRIVGRIAAILNLAANKKHGTKNLRFSWFDSIDDFETAKALFGAVEDWGRTKGMETLTGPHSFTDLDPEGLLVEGFEELGTIATTYNYPYYPALLERYGFIKEIDYVEFQAQAPPGTEIPERMVKMAEWAQKRGGYHLIKDQSIRRLRKERAQEMFDLIDEAYEELYGTIPLTQAQKNYYVGKYMPFVSADFLKIVVNSENKMVGFLIAMPSLSRAFQKAKGRLFPFGLLHILRALRRFTILDFYLVGVKKEYRGKGVDLTMAIDVFKACLAKGVRLSESNPELENNTKIQNEWKIVSSRQHKRRRIYRKNIA
jgi:hypothetical protein